jgi:hypothetical protein
MTSHPVTPLWAVPTAHHEGRTSGASICPAQRLAGLALVFLHFVMAHYPLKPEVSRILLQPAAAA